MGREKYEINKNKNKTKNKNKIRLWLVSSIATTSLSSHVLHVVTRGTM